MNTGLNEQLHKKLNKRNSKHTTERTTEFADAKKQKNTGQVKLGFCIKYHFISKGLYTWAFYAITSVNL